MCVNALNKLIKWFYGLHENVYYVPLKVFYSCNLYTTTRLNNCLAPDQKENKTCNNATTTKKFLFYLWLPFPHYFPLGLWIYNDTRSNEMSNDE